MERLRAMRRLVFGLGMMQVGVCAAVVGGGFLLIGQTLASAAVLGMGLALSSTAVVMPVLGRARAAEGRGRPFDLRHTPGPGPVGRPHSDHRHRPGRRGPAGRGAGRRHPGPVAVHPDPGGGRPGASGAAGSGGAASHVPVGGQGEKGGPGGRTVRRRQPAGRGRRRPGGPGQRPVHEHRRPGRGRPSGRDRVPARGRGVDRTVQGPAAGRLLRRRRTGAGPGRHRRRSRRGVRPGPGPDGGQDRRHLLPGAVVGIRRAAGAGNGPWSWPRRASSPS